MQIDQTDLLKKSAVIAGAISVTVCAPYLAPFVLAFLSPAMIEIGKAGVATVGGVASNALWDIKDSFKASHENENLARLLGNAYSEAIKDVLVQAETDENFGRFADLVTLILPSIKEEIDEHLRTERAADLEKLFPMAENLLEITIDGEKKVPFFRRLLGKKQLEFKSVNDDLLSQATSEDFILKISDNSAEAKKLLAEEVEISLRRWFVQLNPKLADEYTFPPCLDKFVFEKIGELIPVKINELVTREDLGDSWKAFQRSHLQAILKQVNNLNNGLSEDDRELLRPLGEFLDKLSENNEFVKKLGDGHLEILKRVGESEENIKKKIAEESKNLQSWFEKNFSDLIREFRELKEAVKQAIIPEKEGIELNLVTLPNRISGIYGRDEEIKEILRFLKEETKHGAIVLPTCYGKTSLIIQFLKETTNATEVKDEYQRLFEKVVYIFCYANQTFPQIIKPFASLQGKILEYTKGDEVNFLKQEVFDRLQSNKILLIIDNFESWIDENEKYLNDDVGVFLETLLNSNHQIRTLFVSQKLPHTEKDFKRKIVELKNIEDELLKGLDKESALKLVRTEGDEEDFKYVSDADLEKFFERVYYIPQAIQSMLGFIDDEALTFQQLMTEFWDVFDAAESDETDLEKQIPKKLRPTRALLKHQIGKLDENAAHLLMLTAFFESVVPEEILLGDFGDFTKNDLRKPLDRLAKHKLMLQATDEMPETDETTGAQNAIHYYSLHGFVRDITKTMFPDFARKNPDNLTTLADQMNDKQEKAWDKKLFDKHLALVECWERLENYLVVDQKISSRQYFLDLIDFTKAVALQETSFAVKKNLSPDEIKKRVEIIEKLYLQWLAKYPNNEEAYNNLGVLLAKDESRRAEAEAKYDRAIELNPKYAKAYNNLGALLAEDESRWTEAEAKYEKAIELNPNDAEAYYNLGNLLAKDESRRADAEAKYEKAIELNPKFANAYYNLGALLFKDESRRADAEAKYNKAIELNPKYAKAYNNLGVLLAEDESRREEAEAKYEKAIELNPNDADAYNNLGVLLAEDESRRAEAEEKYNTAIELNPKFAKAYFNLACLRSVSRKDENKEEAFEFLKKAVELDSKCKEDAKTDADFDFIRDDARFAEIVGGDDGKGE